RFSVTSGAVKNAERSMASCCSGNGPFPVKRVFAPISDRSAVVPACWYDAETKPCSDRVGDRSRQPSSSKTCAAAKSPNRSPCTPALARASLRPHEPYSSVPSSPGSENPVLVSIDSAPPSVLRPKIGFDPGITLTDRIAFEGTRSQLTVSPNGSFRRTPSRYIDRPCGAPSRGDARKPRYCTSGCSGLFCTSLMWTPPSASPAYADRSRLL